MAPHNLSTSPYNTRPLSSSKLELKVSSSQPYPCRRVESGATDTNLRRSGFCPLPVFQLEATEGATLLGPVYKLLFRPPILTPPSSRSPRSRPSHQGQSPAAHGRRPRSAARRGGSARWRTAGTSR